MTEPLVKVNVKGVDELIDGLDELREHIGESALLGFLDLATHAATTVQSRLPHVSGRLASTVGAKLYERSQRARVMMGKRLPYGGWVEFGGGRYAATRPFMPGGRYLYPLAREASHGLEPAGNRATESAIRRQRWRRPT